MAKRKEKIVEFPFYLYLRLFIEEERKKIYSSFKPLSKKFLNFNNPENPTAFLRKPQFEALEMYVFLKEYCDNKYLFEVFEDWFQKKGRFQSRPDVGVSTGTGQYGMFGPSEFQTDDKEAFKEVFEQIKSFKQIYPNYIFALTMGLGKTVLMATSIFYEFLLSNKYPKEEKYCHNALVFAPDKTVLQSLKEIQTFNKSKVIPPEYVNWLETNVKFFFLDETGDALNAIENSMFNIIISNTQKIILKKQHKDKTPSQALFEDFGTLYKAKSLNKDFEDLYNLEIDTDQALITNQRFAKLTRLKQLGIYVDEAHHVFGNALAADFGLKNTSTSLRVTINELAENLSDAGTKVVGCYNYTGTPYVGTRLLPEVVYSYGLRDAIDNKYLKKVSVSGFKNIKDQTVAFVREAIKEFWNELGENRFEGMLPKIAFFASTIEELQTELRPAVEKVLSELKISLDKILVNVGDPKITSNDDIREFINLDTKRSEKQFILLVNKGKEGWNCRSLFGVGLHREPRSKVFVLQATMRCLRQISEIQQRGMVFLSEDNVAILNKELEENFRMTIDDLTNAGDKKEVFEIRTVPPPVKVKLRRIRKLHQLKEKPIKEKLELNLKDAETDKYKITRSERSITDLSKAISAEKDVTYIKEKREFSKLTLIAEIARYLNISPIKIDSYLESSSEGMEEILKIVNEFNEILYDWIVPRLFNELFEVQEFKTEDEVEIELVKEPEEGCYKVKADPSLVANLNDPDYAHYKGRSFHLDNYCFDSRPENLMFWSLIHNVKVDKVWFTGMLTHGQTDFVIHYIDPESHTLRSYYPDFLVQLKDGSYVIVEVKGDNKIDDLVVKAKAEYANQMATASKMQYRMIKGSEAANGISVN